MFRVSGWLLRHHVRVFIHRMRFPGQPMFVDETAREMIGKRIIVGISHENHAHQILSREQFHGRIVRVSLKEGIIVQTATGEEKRLPPDLRAISGARRGEYTFRSSGEVVVDPDLHSTWIHTLPPPVIVTRKRVD